MNSYFVGQRLIIRFQSSIILSIANKLKVAEVVTVLKASSLLKTQTTPASKFFVLHTVLSSFVFSSKNFNSTTVAENSKKLNLR